MSAAKRCDALVVTAALLGFLGVAFGAFGAHELKVHFESHPEALDWYRTAAIYQLFHVLAAILAALSDRGPAARRAGWSFLLGIVIFSGSLYVMALTGVTQWGMVTPFGGTLLIIGWLMFAFAFLGKGARVSQ